MEPVFKTPTRMVIESRLGLPVRCLLFLVAVVVLWGGGLTLATILILGIIPIPRGQAPIASSYFWLLFVPVFALSVFLILKLSRYAFYRTRNGLWKQIAFHDGSIELLGFGRGKRIDYGDVLLITLAPDPGLQNCHWVGFIQRNSHASLEILLDAPDASRCFDQAAQLCNQAGQMKGDRHIYDKFARFDDLADVSYPQDASTAAEIERLVAGFRAKRAFGMMVFHVFLIAALAFTCILSIHPKAGPVEIVIAITSLSSLVGSVIALFRHGKELVIAMNKAQQADIARPV